jgi:hypothetical protein
VAATQIARRSAGCRELSAQPRSGPSARQMPTRDRAPLLRTVIVAVLAVAVRKNLHIIGGNRAWGNRDCAQTGLSISERARLL